MAVLQVGVHVRVSRVEPGGIVGREVGELHALAYAEEDVEDFLLLGWGEGAFEELVCGYGIVYEHVEDVAVGPVWNGGVALLFDCSVYVAYGVYSVVGLGGGGEDDTPGIADGGEEAAEGIGR